ncbi:PD-(D/E)XK nuclease family protein [Lentilactobacillus kosonis]|uniref:ATP-dependent nuclease, subunit B n=1 Tax=Lentilactobacillus kosonis TaxID=2810561 RepID=A0A401FJM9_9LACO|nr:PD-(D/E)XK nuclease family protein [Lentilactobacillus kosonis]GAY72563.1 ATP-dependent nuclease, subunit B [Lentilactobacillus kosonis]
MKYITSQLEKAIRQMIVVTRDQQKRTKMRPKKTELIFGQPGQGNLAGLHYDLNDGKDILVRGRIDRIDEMEINGKQYFSVIDYKSADRKFEIPKAYVGVSMQLLTYLDVVRQNLDDLATDDIAQIAGALYLHIKNSKFSQTDLQKVAGDVEKQLLIDHSFKGILVKDPDLLTEIDQTFSHGERKSLFLPIQLNKDNTPSKRNSDSLIEPQLLDRFLEHNERLIQDAGRRILTGDVSLSPVKMTDMSAMQFTPYKSIMNLIRYFQKINTGILRSKEMKFSSD